MKKLIVAFALLMALCLALSVAMADDLADSKSIINLMYKNKPASTPKDYELIGTIPIEDKVYEIEWTTDSDTIQVIREESGKVIIDVDENNPKELEYVLTATVKDEAGNSVSVSFNRFVPAAINLDVLSPEEIVAIAFTLEDQAKLPAATALTGTIVKAEEYSEKYGNINVYIQIGDLVDNVMECYRLTGEGADKLQVGDEISVAGTIKNYKSTIEFDSGCYLIPKESVQSARVVLYAFGTLEEGAAMTRESTVTGVIVKAEEYSEKYGNINVWIDVPGLKDCTMECYRLKGEGAADLKIGDVITVTGTIKNYKGTIEFDSGCQIIEVIKAN